MNAAILEIEYLADAKAPLPAAVVTGVLVGGDRQRQLVCIALPVTAGKAVVVEQLAESKREFAGVEQRQLVLFLVGYVEVKQPGFQRLVAPVGGEPVEYQPRVELGSHRGSLAFGFS